MQKAQKTKLSKQYLEAYKTNPEGTKQELSEDETLKAEDVTELCEYMDALIADENIGKDVKPDAGSLYKPYDLFQGKFETVNGVRTFGKIGKPTRTNVMLTDMEVAHFNDARKDSEPTMVTLQAIPSQQN